MVKTLDRQPSICVYHHRTISWELKVKQRYSHKICLLDHKLKLFCRVKKKVKHFVELLR